MYQMAAHLLGHLRRFLLTELTRRLHLLRSKLLRVERRLPLACRLTDRIATRLLATSHQPTRRTILRHLCNYHRPTRVAHDLHLLRSSKLLRVERRLALVRSLSDRIATRPLATSHQPTLRRLCSNIHQHQPFQRHPHPRNPPLKRKSALITLKHALRRESRRTSLNQATTPHPQKQQTTTLTTTKALERNHDLNRLNSLLKRPLNSTPELR